MTQRKDEVMKSPYEIWDNDTFNIVYTYPTLEEALASVREEVAANGRESAASWVLQYDDRTTIRNIADGEDLVRLAVEAAPMSIHR
jgi:hypothetical protein